ncbi:MAG: DUF2786 domain-containing protein [Polyangiaceae bacterium]
MSDVLEAGPLSEELERLLLARLRQEYEDENHRLFKKALRTPVLFLSDNESFLGRYMPAFQTLEISRKLVLTKPWGIVQEVLKHEMAHQYVHDVLHIHDETSHGPAFRHVCEKRGIDPRATGLPDESAPEEGQDRVLERVAKLLALAESSSEHEAQAAMNAAQRLMLKYNLDHVSAKTARRYAFRHLGTPTGRVAEWERFISMILRDHFFVDPIWVSVYRPREGTRASVLEVCGTDANLEMAAYVYDFLSHAGERLWREHQRATRTRGNRDRRAFIAGVMSGFYAKLNEERATQREAGLVWKGDADLQVFFRARHPSIVHTRYSGSSANPAHQRGRAAGQKLILHKPVTAGPSGRTLLLK